MRLDVALHALRLFKSRSQAATAIEDGEVLLDGERAKPSRELRPGGRILLRGPHGARELEVLALPRRGLARDAARALVREVDSSASRADHDREASTDRPDR